MKYGLLFSLSLSGLFVATAALAGPTITFDEHGHAFVGLSSPKPVPVTWSLSVDPMSKMKTLTYDIAGALGGVMPTAGDVCIFEPGSLRGPSDLLRFGSTGQLYVFSGIEPGDKSLASVGTPLTTHAVYLKEITNPDGSNGVTYTPALSQPAFHPESGYITGGITYRFLSEGTVVLPVPEPSTFILAGLGALGLVSSRLRRSPPPAV